MVTIWNSFIGNVTAPAFIWLLFSVFVLIVIGLSIFMFRLWRDYGGQEKHMLVMKIVYVPVLAIFILLAALALTAFSFL